MGEKKYIDADYLLEELSFYADRPTKSAMKMIKDIAQHPADVIERKRGKWIYSDNGDIIYDSYYCSCCHQYITVDAERKCDIGFIIDDFNYCQNCGAEMGGEKDAETN